MSYIYIYDISSLRVNHLTLILLTWRKWWTPNNASKRQMGFNSAFKGLMCSNIFFFENRAVDEIMLLNTVQTDWPQMAILYGACALHCGYVRLQTHTIRICNTNWFSTTTVVTRNRLSVTLCVHCVSCFNTIHSSVDNGWFVIVRPNKLLHVATPVGS